MNDPGTGPTRRWVLGAGGAGLVLAGLGGCGLFDDDPEPPPAPHPLAPLRDTALALAAAHGRTVAVLPALQPRLAPIAAAHREHAAALQQVIAPGTPPSAAPSAAPSAPASAAPTPATGEKNALADLRAAERAGLLGSIAAARACHAEALR